MNTSPTPRQRAVLGQLSDMDLRLLQVFKAVVECGGMAAAELELNIGTSTVSRHVKDLETRLGLTLCRRGRAGFALTPEGQRVYEETQRLLASVRGFRDSIDDIHARMGGQLAVAVFDKTASNPRSHIGVAIKDLKLPENCVIAAIIRQGQVIVPRGVTVFEVEDEVLAVTDRAGTAKLAELLSTP